LGRLLLNSFTCPSSKIISRAFLLNILKHMRWSMLLQEIKTLSVFLPNFLPKLEYELKKATLASQNNLQCSTFDIPQVQSAGAPDDLSSCMSGRQEFNRWRRPEYNARELNFLEESRQYMGQYTKSPLAHVKNLNINVLYLQYVVKCISVGELCGCDTIEVFKTTPARKICHSNKAVVVGSRESALMKLTHLCVTFPHVLVSFIWTRAELSKRSHKCLPHLPRSSECRVSYEIAL
jgi:hypothetical protein